jgi:phage/plasmid-associated DNA primase
MRYDMVGKAANIVAELTDSKPIPENYLKMGVTGDACVVKKLFNDTVPVRLRVQNIWATNPTTMPVIAGGMGREIQKRFVVLLFPRTIPKDERNDQVEFIGTTYATEFTNFVVEEAGRYIAQGGFTIPVSSAEAMDQWVKNDAALAWLAERLIILGELPMSVTVDNTADPEARELILIKGMWQDFVRWHIAEKLRAPTMVFDRFARRIATALKDRKGVEKANYGGRGYYGVKLREPTEDMERIDHEARQWEEFQGNQRHGR